MVKLVKRNYNRRVIFLPGKQQQFLLKALQNLNLSWALFAEKIGVHKRTLNDWKREEYSMPLNVVKKVYGIAKVELPKNAKIKEPFWYVYKGAKIGGKLGAIACFKKYGSYGGDPEYRKKKWYEWWEREGRYKKHSIIGITKPIKKPSFSEELAEFVGIMLGDGGITRYQATITFHFRDEKEYSKFCAKLIKRLFDVPISVHYDKSSLSIDLVISRSELVRFCIEKLGLKKGNKVKQQVDIPNWIRRNRSYSIACLRGLVDTDGCIFTHHYKVNGKWYSYKKLAFSNRSKPLLKSVFQIFKMFEMNPRITKDGKDTRLESIKDLQQYFSVVNSHNPKILQQYKN